ncbi:hypothetical protein DU43_03020 [Methanosarcina mazei]|uniref:Uncharacterized protein n=3 Tax=Methanosarcina TaxID=2207 RepID=A0A0F8IZY8_METMZ|nr:hypothetical protein DU43_03020 [Methanosarcina mazei]
MLATSSYSVPVLPAAGEEENSIKRIKIVNPEALIFLLKEFLSTLTCSFIILLQNMIKLIAVRATYRGIVRMPAKYFIILFTGYRRQRYQYILVENPDYTAKK